MAGQLMGGSGPELAPRGLFAERFALLYAEAGDPALKRVTGSVTRSRRLDDRGRPIRISAQRVSDWRRGRNVPARFAALSVVLEVVIGEARKLRPRPLGDALYELDAWRTLWKEALASPVPPAGESATAAGQLVSSSTPDDPGSCPYRGLAAFTEAESAWFFGRVRSTQALLSRLDDALETGGVVMLVGASGAGKSSLIRAGLGPALRAGALVADGTADWPVVMMTPRADPIEELVHHIPELADPLDWALSRTDDDLPIADHQLDPSVFADGIRAALAAYVERVGVPGARLVLIADQFEEAFTLSCDENRLRLFIQALHAVASPGAFGAPPGVVVLGLRADFYSRCLDYPELAEALQDRQMVLGAMFAAELREAVAQPAKAVGLQLETGLADLMLRDLGVTGGRAQAGGRGAYDAGALPLLSHALLATWQRRQAGKLTISGYRAAGGIQGAVAATAERAWAELDAAGQAAARPLLLRLVHVGEDTQDTRRRSTRQELLEQAANRAPAEEALEVLAGARLVTLDAGSVEITHEALLHAWPRLRGWIDQDRAGNLLRQRLEEDAEAWEEQGRDSSLPYRGARLENVHAAAGGGIRTAPGGAAGRFLAAVVGFALIAASTAALAIRQRDDAQFRQVVTEADRMRDSDPSLAAQLDLVAHHLRPDDADVRSRLLSTQNVPLATPLGGHTGSVYLTSFSPNGRVLATASYDHTVRLWDVADQRDADRSAAHRARGHGALGGVQSGRPDAGERQRRQVGADVERRRSGGRPTARRTAGRTRRGGMVGGVQSGRAVPGDRQLGRHRQAVEPRGPGKRLAARPTAQRQHRRRVRGRVQPRRAHAGIGQRRQRRPAVVAAVAGPRRAHRQREDHGVQPSRAPAGHR